MTTPDDAAVPEPEEPASRDAAYWAKGISTLQVGEVPEEAVNINVTGRRVVGPMQGFGKMWQKTYRVELTGTEVTPAEVISEWKANFQSFWPKRNWFYGPITGIAPGEVALLNLTAPGRLKLSTGVLVMYADEESFTFMTPQGHMFAGWVTFSASELAEHTAVQAQVLMRANDPLYELAMAIAMSRGEDRFWEQTLASLATHFGVAEPDVSTTAVCVDKRRQWANWTNIRYNAGIRSTLYTLSVPFRRLARLLRRGR
jgi:hypothetical protein